jgi:hypothetical protein
MTAAQRRMTSDAVAGEVAAPPRRLRHLIPAVVFVALALMLGWALNHDPRELPSALIDKPVPQFSLAPVKERARLVSQATTCGARSPSSTSSPRGALLAGKSTRCSCK